MPANTRNRSGPSRDSSFCRPPSITLGGEASFKQVEPQVEEALFLERMQPKLREYLTKLREEAAIEIKPGAVDTGASGNEMHLTYSAYTPSCPQEEKEVCPRHLPRQDALDSGPDRQASCPRGRSPNGCGPTAAAAAAGGTTATAPRRSATPAATTSTTQQASNNDQNVQKPGKREKIRFGQAPRESLPSSQVATAVAPDNAPAVTTPETRYVNPDGTVSGTIPISARTQDPPEQPAAGAQGKEIQV